jgi:predicted phosphodiesterase
LSIQEEFIVESMSIRIALLSDTHGANSLCYPCLADADIVVLAGDIGAGTEIISYAKSIADKYAVPVITIAGNHEYYGNDYLETLPDIRESAAQAYNVYFLENDCIQLTVNNKTIRILGATLWSDFSLYGDARRLNSADIASNKINDFRVIRYGQNQHKLSPEVISKFYRQSVNFLNKELSKPTTSDKTIVITHFAPTLKAIPQRFTGSELAAYFITDQSALIKQYDIDAWLFGHTHHSIDVIQSGTRIVSNQFGYDTEGSTTTGFDPAKVISISTSTDYSLHRS